MKRTLLTVMALASLIIATQAQTQTAVSQGPVTGSSTSSDGTFTVFHGPPTVVLSVLDNLYLQKVAERTAALDALIYPTVELPNGIAWRKAESTKEYNHDGLAFQGYVYPVHEFDSEAVSPASSSDYAKNIKSGKWRKFENGE